MKGRQVVLDHMFGEPAAALMQDGQLIDLIIDSGEALAPGAICRCVTERLMKGQGGVFVRLPDGQRGYLRERSGISEGQPMLVQVAGVAEEGKAIPLSTRLVFRGRYGLVTPGAPGVNVSRRIRASELREALQAVGHEALQGRDYGIVIRSAAEHASHDEIREELTPLLELADRIMSERMGQEELLLDAPDAWEQAWLDWAEPEPDAVEQGEGSFDQNGVSDAVEALLSPRVDLPGGASAFVEATRALVAVDVNTGRDTSPAASLKANIAIARDLPRQLRLRGLGGQIVVDFAPMPKRDRATLDQVIRAAFKADSTEASMIGWTAMGLYEISRKRDRVPLARLAAEAF
ncbi:ribonuclease E/G [Paracoccus seriniphilus]|uniref:Ribonuclease, Rne/Rng family n=1 Tax=Paracoccus seriniphilus TaxID=184748 RepID=A0A239PXJ8_9RHOB|nr:ribonuclease E/G [Paracoccus seriniphilus]WCR13369.1 ribonuclease E/G [Paracoccus seriniphilus]SNT74387.1 ribonuclease, Rne/Rng family [Paracoccus seriniphilus]